VVVGGTQHDRLTRLDRRSIGGRWPPLAGQNAEHVAAFGLQAFDRRSTPDPPALQRAALRLERFIDRLLDLGQ